jgi:hypothetical protein
MKIALLMWIGFALALIVVLLNTIRVVWEDDVGLRRLGAHLEKRRLEAAKVSNTHV